MIYLEQGSPLLLAIFIYMICISCQGTNIEHDPQTPYLTDSVLKVSEPIPLSAISTQSRYMVIDTTGGNYIRNIKKFCNAGNDYLIVDDREIIYIVDQTGTVKRKFQHVGKGPGEYLEIATLTVDPQTQNIYLRCRKLNKLIAYNIQGDLITESQIEGYFIDDLSYYGSHLIGLSSFPMYLMKNRSPEYVFIFDQNFNIIDTEIHPLWTKSSPEYFQNPIFGTGSTIVPGGIVFYEMYQNGRFYILDPDNDWKIRQWLEIKMENQLEDKLMLAAHEYQTNLGIFIGSNYIAGAVITPNYLFMSMVNGNIHRDFKSVLYDIRNNTFSTVVDFAGYPRLWDDVNGFYSFWPIGFLEHSNELYFFQNPGKMMQEYNEAVGLSPGSFMETDPEIITIFEEAKKMGNPVIQLVEMNR